VPYMLVTSNLSMRSNFRFGLFGLPSLLFSRCLLSRRRLSCRSFSSSGVSTLPLRSITDDSEFRRAPLFFGDDSTGSANISSSAAGRDLLEPVPAPPLLAVLWPLFASCDPEGRRSEGGRGRTFSLLYPALATAVYGGSSRSSVLDRPGPGRVPSLTGGLSLRVRLSYVTKSVMPLQLSDLK
jgi:hypothetical protein